MRLTTTQLANRIVKTRGKFFTVAFLKRTTGSVRIMSARLGVKKHLKGGSPAYNFTEKNLISVYDIENKGYRTIPVESLVAAVIDGVNYFVTDSCNPLEKRVA